MNATRKNKIEQKKVGGQLTLVEWSGMPPKAQHLGQDLSRVKGKQCPSLLTAMLKADGAVSQRLFFMVYFNEHIKPTYRVP